MIRAVAIAGILVAGPGLAVADRPAEPGAELVAEQALADAARRAITDPAAAIERYEAIGGAAPATRWTAQAWASAARLAEQTGEIGRARRDLERVIASGGDPRLAERARGDLARLTARTAGGRWDAVASVHDRLAGQLAAGGDPWPALVGLELLVAASPGYPGATAAVLSVARGWQRDGDLDRARAWLAAHAATAPVGDLRIALAQLRLAIDSGQLAEAELELARAAAQPAADRAVIGELRVALDTAERRRWLRAALAATLLGAVALGLVGLWRESGSVRGALRRLARPPGEIWFLLPVGAVLVGVAATGNPGVARAVRHIVIAGLAISWLSGAALDARARARGGLAGGRAIVHAVAATIAIAAAAYLVLDHDHLLGLVAETWRGGPAMR